MGPCFDSRTSLRRALTGPDMAFAGPSSGKYSGPNTLPNDPGLSSRIVLILPYAFPFGLRMLVTIHGVGQYYGDERTMHFVGRNRTAAS